MSFDVGRLDGGVHFVNDNLVSGTVTVVSSGFGGSGVAWTIAHMIYTRNTATSIRVEDTGGGDITPTIDSNILLDKPKIGGRKGRGIQLVTVGAGGRIALTLYPDRTDAYTRLGSA